MDRGSAHRLRYCVEKGSIAVSGVSLTIAAVAEDAFAVALVPHTLETTTLGSLGAGDAVNLEADLIGKYVERLLPPAYGYDLRMSALAETRTAPFATVEEAIDEIRQRHGSSSSSTIPTARTRAT